MKANFGILMDLDGVLGDTMTAVLAHLYAKYGYGNDNGPHSVEIIHDWDLLTCIPGLTEDHLFSVFRDYDFWGTIAPYAGAVKFMQNLYEQFEVHIVTDRRWFPMLANLTGDWLDEYNIPYDFLAMVKGSDKWDYAKSYGLYAAVEDSPGNIASLAASNGHVAVVNRPWNKAQVLPEFAYRTHNYEQIFHVIVAAELEREERSEKAIVKMERGTGPDRHRDYYAAVKREMALPQIEPRVPLYCPWLDNRLEPAFPGEMVTPAYPFSSAFVGAVLLPEMPWVSNLPDGSLPANKRPNTGSQESPVVANEGHIPSLPIVSVPA